APFSGERQGGLLVQGADARPAGGQVLGEELLDLRAEALGLRRVADVHEASLSDARVGAGPGSEPLPQRLLADLPGTGAQRIAGELHRTWTLVTRQVRPAVLQQPRGRVLVRLAPFFQVADGLDLLAHPVVGDPEH